MMKLTVTFLMALAVADAAEVRRTRQSRRQIGANNRVIAISSSNTGDGGNTWDGDYGYGDFPVISISSIPPVSTPDVPVMSSSSMPAMSTPDVPVMSTPDVPVMSSSSMPAMSTPDVPVMSSSSMPAMSTPDVPVMSSSSMPAMSTPDVPVMSSSSMPAMSTPDVPVMSSSSMPAMSSPSTPVGNDYGYGPPLSTGGANSVPMESASTPAPSSAYGSRFSTSVPAAVQTPPAGIYPPSGVPNVPTGGIPSGGYGGVPSMPAGVPPSPARPYGAVSSSAVPSVPAGGYGGGQPSPTPVEDMITKTIYSTQVITKTACPASVTDCPHKSTHYITSIVPVGTTVCPHEDDSPEPTPPPQHVIEYPVSEVVTTITETLVYTVGVGSTAHPITTKIVSTRTSTVYKTVVVTVAKPTPSPNVPVGTEGYPTDLPGEDGEGEGEDCPVPVTVTVTAKETVYITKGSRSVPTPNPRKPTMPENEHPAFSKVPSEAMATPSAWYPIGNGNGTHPAGPTGFKTSTLPAYPVPSKPMEGYPAYPGTPMPSTPAAATSNPAVYSPPGGDNGYGAVPEPPSSASVKTPTEAKATPTPVNNYGSSY